MDKCKDAIYRHQGKIKIILITSIAISLLNCFSRFDYNFVVFLYLYFLWDNNIENKQLESTERVIAWFFLCFTVLADLLWLFTWPSKWSKIKDFQSTIHFIVSLSSWINLGLKGVIIFSVGLINWSSIRSSLPKTVQEKLTGNYKEQVDE